MNITKIKNALRGKRLTFVNVEKTLNKLGYSVVLFNTYAGDREIERYYLDNEKNSLKAFTYYEAAHIVFVDGSLHSDDILYLLLHELGHICLGHIGDGKLSTRNKILIDIEADNFAYSIINRKQENGIFILFSAIILSVSILTAGIIYKKQTTANTHIFTQSAGQEETTEQPLNENTDMVYVTPSGKKFHKQNCFYAKGKNLLELTREQASSRYLPCAVCNP